MKKWFWYSIGIIVFVGLVSCLIINHEINGFTYKNVLQNGRAEIKNKQYNSAQNNFKKATEIKPNSMEANNLFSQTSKFVDAENKFKDYDFSGASESFNDVMNYNQGSSVLESRAKVELKVLKQVSGNVDRLEKIYNQALKQNKAKQFAASNVTLEGIFDDDLATNTFYAGIVKEAKKLKSANDNQVVLSKFKAKKHSSADDKTSDKKKKKTKKITKASKETSSEIDAVNNSVVPSVSNNDTTASNGSSTYNSGKQSIDNKSSSNSSASDNTTSNPDPDNNSNSSQTNTPDPVEKHDSNSNNNKNDSESTPASKPDDGGSGSPHSNEPATPPADSKGNEPANRTPSN